jgi:hypothetical protein
MLVMIHRVEYIENISRAVAPRKYHRTFTTLPINTLLYRQAGSAYIKLLVANGSWELLNLKCLLS